MTTITVIVEKQKRKEKEREMDEAAVAIAEPQPKPPRRISDAPSARNLKPRHVYAVRRWPPGCGRFPPPPPSFPPPPSLPVPYCSSPVSLTPTTRPDGKIDNISVTNEELLVNCATLVSDSNTVPDHLNQPLESPPPPEDKIDNSPVVANGESLGNHLNLEAVEEKEKEKEKGNLSNKRWMNSKVYPPPKRRAVSAIRCYPLSCGRKPDFCLGLIDPQPAEPNLIKWNR